MDVNKDDISDIALVTGNNLITSKACPAVGHKGHMPLINQIRGAICPCRNSKWYVPASDEKTLIRCLESRHQKLSLFSFYKLYSLFVCALWVQFCPTPP